MDSSNSTNSDTDSANSRIGVITNKERHNETLIEYLQRRVLEDNRAYSSASKIIQK